MRRLALMVLGLAVVTGVAPATTVSSGDGAFLGRAFTIQATAYPIEPAPGRAESPVYSRPVSSAVSVANAPPTAYGRSASYDPGTLELYTGPPPADSYVECDVTSANLPLHAAKEPGGTQLVADCSKRPSASASARGSNATGTVASRVSGDGGGDALVAESVAEIHNAVIGDLRLSSAAFTGRVRADGRPGGASAEGRVEVTEASFAGIPVTIGPGGMTVDDQRVPIELVPEATRQLAAASQQGGYGDVRVVQPKAEASEDGTKASVGGGGVFVYGTNNDPTDRYFVQLTLVGGTAAVSLGGVLDVAGADDIAPPSPVAPSAAGATPTPPRSSVGTPASRVAPPAVTTPERVVDAPVLGAGRERHDLPRAWRGWPWLIGACLVCAGAAVAARRWTVPWWNGMVDRYLRG